MVKLASLDFEDEDMKSHIHQELLIIEIKQNAFKIATDISESNYLFDLLSLAESQPQIKIVFIFNRPGCLSDIEYQSYLQDVYGKDSVDSIHAPASTKRQVRQRQINILNHFILEVRRSNKLIVIGLQGCVVTPFFGAALATDLRYASDDLVFSLAHVNFGLHPSGALPYFLPKYIGLNHTQNYLYHGGTSAASRALDIGLINKVYPANNFLDSCLSSLKKIKKNNLNVIMSTKQLFNRSAELERYFEQERKFSLL